MKPTEQDLADLARWQKTEKRPHAVLGLVEVVFPHPELKPVLGVRYDPPTVHLGVRIADDIPANIGDLLLTYLTGMLDEAECLAP